MHAEDGDKGSPREIRYGLVSEGNPFTSFFNINDTTGMLGVRSDMSLLMFSKECVNEFYLHFDIDGS